MKFTMSPILVVTVCTLASLMSTTEGTYRECTTRCEITQSKAAEKCIKKHPITDSDDRILCNRAFIDKEDKCSSRCREIANKCWEKCWYRATVAWEPCVVDYEDYKDPRRLKCIGDVSDALYRCNARC